MLQSYKLYGMFAAEQGESERQTLYNMQKSRAAFVKIGSRCNLCRFLDTSDRASDRMPHWWADYHERLVLSLDCDFLKGKFLEHPLTLRSGYRNELTEAPEITHPSALNVADKSIRSCCQNAVLISLMMLQEETHKRLVETFILYLPG
jgi:hypothetical protein